MRRLGAPPGRLRWVLLLSVLGHVAVLVLLKLLGVETAPRAHRQPVALEVLRPTAIEPRPAELGGAHPESPAERSSRRVEIVAAHDREETPEAPTERESARDQRSRQNAAPSRTALRPGTTSTARRSTRPAGGHPSWAAQDGAPLTQRGGLREGDDQLARGRRSGGGAPSGGPVDPSPGVPGRSGRPQGGAMGRATTQLLPSSWAPIAVRQRPAGPPVEAPAEPRSQGPAPETRSRRPLTGGSPSRGRAPVPVPERPTPAAPSPVDGAEPTRRHEPLGDPVAELREALGWGPLDRATLAPRPEDPGRDGLSGGTDGGGRAVPEASSWTRAVDAHGTALGAWAEEVDARIYGRWATLDLPMEERARGLQGDVTVRYHVLSGGRVRDVAVVRSSGHPSLDALAISAVPARLPRPPSETRPHGVVYEHTLTYRNPLVLISPQ